MTNRIVLIVTIIILALLVLSVSLIVLIGSSHPQSPVQVTTPNENASPAEAVVLLTKAITQEPSIASTLSAPVTPTPLFSAASQTSLGATPQTPPPDETLQPSTTVSELSPSVTKDTVSSPSPDMQCKGSGSFTSSLIVEDSNTYEAPFGAELIRLAGINFDSQQIIIIPFSSYLELPVTSLNETYGISKSNLGVIYHTVYQRTTNADQRHSNASLAVNQAIEENFEISLDYYISLNQKFLQQFIEFTGPVEINNPESFSTRLYEYPAGNITVTSSNIWDYLVYNTKTSREISRLQRQDILLEALFNAIHANHSWSELEGWLQNHQGLVRTDMNTDQLVSTFCALSHINEDLHEFEQIPADYFNINPESITIIDSDPVIDFIDQRLSSIH
ncbi:MAG: LCP family protein [Chloroflexi bacterium]|nr:LCP family protein [Chloroflexota bacterium]